MPGAEVSEGKNYRPKKGFACRMWARRRSSAMSCNAMSRDVLYCDELSSVVKRCGAMGWDL